MNPGIAPRHLILGIALCATLAATAWAIRQEDEPLEARAARTSTTPAVTAPEPAVKEPQKNEEPVAKADAVHLQLTQNMAERDLFASKSWYVPPPPPPPAPPPPPSAPPLPFTFMGQFQEDSGKLIVFLAKGDVAYTVSEGDVIDNLYKVESATPRQLVLVYLPLKIKQTLMTGTGS